MISTHSNRASTWESSGAMDRLLVHTVPSSLPEIWSPGGTGIHRAILGGRLHQVRLLISMKAHVDKRDSAGYTPLMVAAMLSPDDHGVKCIKVLLKAGAELNMLDFMGRSALGLACLHGREKAVEVFLLEDKLEKNMPDKNGDTPLNLAASQGFTKIVKMLVSSFKKDGISVDKRNKQGCTALLLATKLGHYDCARILLEEGKASVSSRDNDYFMNSTEWAKFSKQKLVDEIKTRSSMFVNDPRMKSADPRSESVPPPATSSSCRTVRRFIPPFHSFNKEIQMIGQLRRQQEQLTQLIFAFQERDKDRNSESGSRCGKRRKDSRVSSAASAATDRLDPRNVQERDCPNTPLDLGILFRLYTEQQKSRPSQAANRHLLFGSVPSMLEPSDAPANVTGRPVPVRRHNTAGVGANNANSSNMKRRPTITSVS
ncbi:protein TANC2-like [Lytechinus pictus]|uniref:protein TANC2-like n=1 Tax=Lytechinus pictus TaxID=7653 RepID=UPI00240E4FCA|nr:protein TANC2-like [Lytechinus pictus]